MFRKLSVKLEEVHQQGHSLSEQDGLLMALTGPFSLRVDTTWPGKNKGKSRCAHPRVGGEGTSERGQCPMPLEYGSTSPENLMVRWTAGWSSIDRLTIRWMASCSSLELLAVGRMAKWLSPDGQAVSLVVIPWQTSDWGPWLRVESNRETRQKDLDSGSEGNWMKSSGGKWAWTEVEELEEEANGGETGKEEAGSGRTGLTGRSSSTPYRSSVGTGAQKQGVGTGGPAIWSSHGAADALERSWDLGLRLRRVAGTEGGRPWPPPRAPAVVTEVNTSTFLPRAQGFVGPSCNDGGWPGGWSCNSLWANGRSCSWRADWSWQAEWVIEVGAAGHQAAVGGADDWQAGAGGANDLEAGASAWLWRELVKCLLGCRPELQWWQGSTGEVWWWQWAELWATDYRAQLLPLSRQ